MDGWMDGKDRHVFRFLRLVTRRRGWKGLSIRMSSFLRRGGREIREEERREESVFNSRSR